MYLFICPATECHAWNWDHSVQLKLIQYCCLAALPAFKADEVTAVHQAFQESHHATEGKSNVLK
jgi:hypothetical protein